MLNNRLPLKINFGWAVFDVQITAGPLFDSTGDRVFGDVCFDNYLIRVDSTLETNLLQETLIHEITHVILEQSGMGVESESILTNEEKTTLISRNILSMLRLNVDILQVLTNNYGDKYGTKY